MTIVIDQENKDLNLDQIAASLESVIIAEGEVIARDKEAINPNINTGEIEVKVVKLTVESITISFQVNDNNDYLEDLRLKYRFLDLRRKKTHENIILKARLSLIRKWGRWFGDSNADLTHLHRGA